jgi:hypothetical protein
LLAIGIAAGFAHALPTHGQFLSGEALKGWGQYRQQALRHQFLSDAMNDLERQTLRQQDGSPCLCVASVFRIYA